MGRRCTKCDRVQTDKRLALCPQCDIMSTKASKESDDEFAEFFRYYHGDSEEKLPEDVFDQERRLKKLAETAADRKALDYELEYHALLEAKKRELLSKFLVLSNDVASSSKVSSSTEVQPKQSSDSPQPTINPAQFPERKTSINRKVDINSNTLPSSHAKSHSVEKSSEEIKSSALLNASFNDSDEIDGSCILYKDDEEKNSEKKVTIVRRRSSVKDRIQAFEMLSKRTSLGNNK